MYGATKDEFVNDQVMAGDVIGGRYRIVRRIGSGAGGQIYLALDLRLGERETAIKFYEPDALIQDLSEHVRSGIISRDVYDNEVSNIYHRFRQEAIGISRLDHANIVKVYDYQDAEYRVARPNGADRSRTQPFLCMEYIEGMTLEEALTANAITLQMGLLIGSHVADGLFFAHNAGFVHRDLKPSNIMIHGQGAGVQAKIIDWGVAKVVADEAKAAASRLSESSSGEDIRTRGLLLGTPKFIAPEHFERGGAQWTAASDIFSLGMILFRLLTKQPLRRESYVGECLTQSDLDLLKQACAGHPELTEVVLSCLSERREERMTAREVRDNLKLIYNGLSGSTPDKISVTVENETWEPKGSMAREMKTVVKDVSGLTPAVSSVVLAITRNRTPVILGGIVIAVVSFVLLTLVIQGDEESETIEETAVVEKVSEETSDAEGALEEVAEEEVEEETPPFEMTVKLISEPAAIVFMKRVGEDGDLRKLGTTPVDLTFTHEAEAQRLVYRPVEQKYRKIYPEMEVTIFAADFASKYGLDEELEHRVKLKCADLTDPDCNDYLDRFNKVFEEDE